MLSAFAGGAIFGERVGTGDPTVLVLHGWRGDHTQMNSVISGFSAISLDLPGFGASPSPGEAWGASQYAEAVAEVLNEFTNPPVVVGYSVGGRVALNLAAQFPERVQALVLIATPLIRRPVDKKKNPLVFRAAKLAHKVGIISDQRMEEERSKRGSADYRAAKGIMRDTFVKLVNESYERELSKLTCPVELVWGDADTEAPLRNATEAQQVLHSSTLTVIPGGTHWSVIEDAPEARAAIQRCLER